MGGYYFSTQGICFCPCGAPPLLVFAFALALLLLLWNENVFWTILPMDRPNALGGCWGRPQIHADWWASHLVRFRAKLSWH